MWGESRKGRSRAVLELGQWKLRATKTGLPRAVVDSGRAKAGAEWQFWLRG